jgi:hypothetical protein
VIFCSESRKRARLAFSNHGTTNCALCAIIIEEMASG